MPKDWIINPPIPCESGGTSPMKVGGVGRGVGQVLKIPWDMAIATVLFGLTFLCLMLAYASERWCCWRAGRTWEPNDSYYGWLE